MVEATMLADAAARQRVREDLSTTLFVEAGAGSGKTTVLIDRLVNLVINAACPMRSVAAITFTEAAASELRVRLARALQERASDDTDEGRRAVAALGELDEAAITTIHGFARRLLAEHPVEAGLPLRISIIDEIEERHRRGTRFARLLDGLVALDDEDGLLPTLTSAGVHIRALRDLFGLVDERFDELEPARIASPTLSELWPLVADGCAAVLPALRDATASVSLAIDGSDALVARVQGLAIELDLYGEATSPIERLEWLMRLPTGDGTPHFKADAWGAVDGRAIRAAVTALRATYLAARGAIEDLLVRCTLDALATEATEAAAQRQSAGELTFHDLLVLAHRLLVEHSSVRSALADRFRVVFVDEFQDTDPLQLALLDLLVGAGSAPPGGARFFVGDPKQAIYRFRGADIALYRSTRDRIPAENALALSTNFRSVPGVVDFVNATFARLLSQSDDGDEPATELRAHRAAAATDVPVVILGGATELQATDRRAAEAEEIAASIVSVVEDGWAVFDSETETERLAGLSDIAILVPRRTGLDALETALSAHGIAYRVESPTLVYQSTEVYELLAVLKCLARPAVEVALVGALRSAVIGCSDEELLAYRRRGGEWCLGDGRPGVGDDPVAAALAYLGDLGRRRFALDLDELVSTIVVERSLYALAATSAHPLEARRRLEFVFDEVRAFIETGGRSLEDFVSWAEERATGGGRGREAVTAKSATDAVRILTIHGAKGLEFPIVILSELGGQLTVSGGSTALLRDGDRVEARLGALSSSGYAVLKQTEDRRGAEESRRLGYVGATRARDHLVVCLHHTPSGRGATRSLAREIAPIIGDHPELWRTVDLGARGRLRSSDVEVVLEDPEAFAARRAAVERLIERAATPASLAASSLGGEQLIVPTGLRTRALSENAEEDAPVRDVLLEIRRREASAVGRATHAVLERIDLGTGADLAALVERACIEEHCSDQQGAVAAFASAGIASLAARAAVAAPRFWRELPLTVAVGDGVLEGIVDLCYENEDGGLVIVDWKTDAVRDASSRQSRIAHYGLQLGAYALGLGQATGRAIVACHLVFLAALVSEREVDLGPVEPLIDQAQSALVTAFGPRSRLSA